MLCKLMVCFVAVAMLLAPAPYCSNGPNIISPTEGSEVDCKFDITIESSYPLDSCMVPGSGNPIIYGDVVLVSSNYDAFTDTYTTVYRITLCGYYSNIPSGREFTVLVWDGVNDMVVLKLITNNECEQCNNMVTEFRKSIVHTVEPPK